MSRSCMFEPSTPSSRKSPKARPGFAAVAVCAAVFEEAAGSRFGIGAKLVFVVLFDVIQDLVPPLPLSQPGPDRPRAKLAAVFVAACCCASFALLFSCFLSSFLVRGFFCTESGSPGLLSRLPGVPGAGVPATELARIASAFGTRFLLRSIRFSSKERSLVIRSNRALPSRFGKAIVLTDCDALESGVGSVFPSISENEPIDQVKKRGVAYSRG